MAVRTEVRTAWGPGFHPDLLASDSLRWSRSPPTRGAPAKFPPCAGNAHAAPLTT